MQKDRFIFALIIYGIILLVCAGTGAYLLSDNVAETLGIGSVTSSPDPSGVPVTQVPQKAELTEPTKKPEQNLPVTESTDTKPEGAWGQLSIATTAEWRGVIGERCIVLPKPERMHTEDVVLSLTDMPVEQSVALRLQGCTYTEWTYTDIERICGDRYFNAEPAGAVENAEESEEYRDPLKQMIQACTLQEDGGYELYIELLLDKTYVYNVYETETHYFISLKKAKEAYGRIVVLDAGHGGWDTGTVSRDGKVLEKNVNLQVLLYLEDMLKKEGIRVYTTRATDRYIGQKERVALANALEADFFLSIHCNNVYKEDEEKETEVLYNQYDEKQGMNSKRLGELCQKELETVFQLHDVSLQPRGDELTVLQKAEVPAVQVELDADMETEAAQKQAAEALYQAFVKAYAMMSDKQR